MADFLIMDKPNWREIPSKERPELTGHENVVRKISEDDNLSSGEKAGKLILEGRKYDGRYRLNDIVQVRPHGFGMCGEEPLSFKILRVDGVKQGDYDVGAYFDLSDMDNFKAANSWVYLDGSGIVFNKDKIAEIDKAKFDTIFRVKIRRPVGGLHESN